MVYGVMVRVRVRLGVRIRVRVGVSVRVRVSVRVGVRVGVGVRVSVVHILKAFVHIYYNLYIFEVFCSCLLKF